MKSNKSKASYLQDQISRLEAENQILSRKLRDYEQQENRIEPYWEDKVWGRVHHVFCSIHAACSFLEVNKGFCCSKHYHKFRANLFCVHSGIVCIQQWHLYPSAEATWLYRHDVLEPADILTVRAGIKHRFRVIESGAMTEVYFPDGNSVDMKDIVRDDVGGADEQTDLMNEFPQYF